MFEKYFKKSKDKTIIYCPIGTVEKIEQLFNILFFGDFDRVSACSNVEFKEFDNLDNVEIFSNIFATSIEVDHGDFKPAYRIRNKRKK